MAFFFKKFNKIDYGFIGDPSNKKQVQNILTAFFLRKVSSFKYNLFQRYTIRDDDSIESLSSKLYETPMYYWTILVANDIIDPYSEWAKDSFLIEKFTAKKYAEGVKVQKKDGTVYTIPFSVGTGGIHHFFNNHTGRRCDDVEDEFYRTVYARNPKAIGNNIIPVTNLEYERDIDLQNRQISIPAKERVANFQEEFNNMLQGSRSK